jgi:hypothetical protein
LPTGTYEPKTKIYNKAVTNHKTLSWVETAEKKGNEEKKSEKNMGQNDKRKIEANGQTQNRKKWTNIK